MGGIGQDRSESSTRTVTRTGEERIPVNKAFRVEQTSEKQTRTANKDQARIAKLRWLNDGIRFFFFQ